MGYLASPNTTLKKKIKDLQMIEITKPSDIAYEYLQKEQITGLTK
jgi:hypothetical protein